MMKILVLGISITLAGCAAGDPADVYGRPEAGREATVRMATVEQVRKLEIERRSGLEITVKLDNGELRAIVQEADEMFQPGERVRLLSSGGVTRVTH